MIWIVQRYRVLKSHLIPLVAHGAAKDRIITLGRAHEIATSASNQYVPKRAVPRSLQDEVKSRGVDAYQAFMASPLFSCETISTASRRRGAATAELRRLQREALVLGILIDEAIAKEAQQFVQLPLELSKLLEARSQVAVSSRQAGDLLQEHDHKEAEKNAPPKENAVSVALAAFREKWKKEESKRIESTSNGRSEES